MYIRSRKRGTNQYTVKGELKDCVICPHCGAFNEEFKAREIINGFINPRRDKNTNCHKCKKLLVSPSPKGE